MTRPGKGRGVVARFLDALNAEYAKMPPAEQRRLLKAGADLLEHTRRALRRKANRKE